MGNGKIWIILHWGMLEYYWAILWGMLGYDILHWETIECIDKGILWGMVRYV